MLAAHFCFLLGGVCLCTHPRIETFTRALFVVPLCKVVTPPDDLRLHKHQQEGHRKLCCCLPEGMLTAPFTTAFMSGLCFLDVNSGVHRNNVCFSAASCFPFMRIWAFV